MDLRDGASPTGRASSSAGARRRSAASCSASASRNYVESSIGAPKERHRDHRASRRACRCRDRHAAERPGPRDELRAGGGRPARACRSRASTSSSATPTSCSVGGGSHSGRSMRHAATVISKARARPDRQGQAHRGAGARNDAGQDRVQRRPVRVADTNRSFDFLELAKEAARHDAAGRAQGRPRHRRPTTRCTIRCFRTAARSARSRSIPTPARSTITRYAAVDDVGRCINPLIVARPDAWRHRAGRRSGAVGAVLRRSRLRPAADRLVHGLRHAARATPCRRSGPRSSRCCRRPIRSASRPAAKAAPRRRSAVIVSAIVDALRDYGVRDIKMPATPYNIWRTIQGAKTIKDAKTSPDAQTTQDAKRA